MTWINEKRRPSARLNRHSSSGAATAPVCDVRASIRGSAYHTAWAIHTDEDPIIAQDTRKLLDRPVSLGAKPVEP